MDRAHSDDELVQRSREAALRGAWRKAYDRLAAADAAAIEIVSVDCR